MSGEPNTALDRLEAELFRDARLEFEPDQARVDGIWGSIAAASTLAAAVSGVSASVPPASGTAWAAPLSATKRPVTTPPRAVLPSAAPAPAAGPDRAASAPSGLLERLGRVSSGQASFGLRALAIALVGGALLGFAAGYGSAGSARDTIDPPGMATLAGKASSAPSSIPKNAGQEAEAARANPGAASQEADETQAPTTLRGNSTKPQRSSSTPVAESAKPSFYEELEYLKRAQSALRQGNGALALGLMTSLDSIRPGGALLSERGVTKVLAHCQLGDVESATLVARRLAAHGLASVYMERLETSCAGAALPQP